MTKQNIVRILSGLSFLIFICPFFQMCSDDSMIKSKRHEVPTTEETTVVENTSEDIDVEKISPKNNRPITIQTPETETEKEQSLAENRKHYTYNGYKMATYIFASESLKNMETNDLLDGTFHACLLFTLSLLASLAIFILSLKKRFNSVYKLALLNLLFAIVPMVIFYFNGTLEEISQIKFGYYLFIINIVALIIFSRKLKTTSAA